MKYRKLGRTGISVSEVGFGCWAIGGNAYGTVKDSESIEALETAFDRGVTFYDTADVYGFGHSEEVLASFLKSRPQSKMIVASKVGHDFYHGAVCKKFDSNYIREACNKTLSRLQTDYLDLYQLHNPSEKIISQGEALATLEGLKKEGKIRHIGISVHDEATALTALKDSRVEVVQLLLNILQQGVIAEVLPQAFRQGVGVIAREPLACGILTEKYHVTNQFSANDHRRGWTQDKIDSDLEKIRLMKEGCPKLNQGMVQTAIEFAIGWEGVSTVIPGIKRVDQLLVNLKAAEEPSLNTDDIQKIREIYFKNSVFSVES